VLDVAREVVRLAHLGLRNRREINFLNQDETIYLAPLEDIVARGKTCSDELLERYCGRWGGHIDPIFLEFAF
jgi:glutamate--cysteine ligase